MPIVRGPSRAHSRQAAHVDLRYPGPVLLTVDVDAEALRAERTHEPAPAALTLADAATIAARQTGGEVTSVALDDERAGTSRYALDVRVADGRIARLTLDPATQAPGWRTPPVAYE